MCPPDDNPQDPNHEARTTMSDPTQPRRLIDAKELAQHLGISESAVYRKSAAGLLPRYKIGHRTVRFDLDEVRSMLRESTAPQPEHRARPPSNNRNAHAKPLPTFSWTAEKPGS